MKKNRKGFFIPKVNNKLQKLVVGYSELVY